MNTNERPPPKKREWERGILLKDGIFHISVNVLRVKVPMYSIQIGTEMKDSERIKPHIPVRTELQDDLSVSVDSLDTTVLFGLIEQANTWIVEDAKKHFQDMIHSWQNKNRKRYPRKTGKTEQVREKKKNGNGDGNSES